MKKFGIIGKLYCLVSAFSPDHVNKKLSEEISPFQTFMITDHIGKRSKFCLKSSAQAGRGRWNSFMVWRYFFVPNESHGSVGLAQVVLIFLVLFRLAKASNQSR